MALPYPACAAGVQHGSEARGAHVVRPPHCGPELEGEVHCGLLGQLGQLGGSVTSLTRAPRLLGQGPGC